MDLALLVYAISLLDGFGNMGVTLIICSGVTAVALLMYRLAECTQETYYNTERNEYRAAQAKWAMGHVKTALIVLFSTALFLTLLPTQKTAYMMVGAYAAQRVAENDKVQETGSKVLKLIDQKLDQYIDEGAKEVEKAAEKAAEKAKKVTK